MKKILMYIVFTAFFLSLFFIFYNFYIKKDQGDMLIEEVNKYTKEAALIDMYRENISKIQMPKEEFMQGFWYVYIDTDGNEEIRYFDPEALVASGLDKKDILDAFSEAISSKIVKNNNMKINVLPEDLPEDFGFNNKIYASTKDEYINTKQLLIDKKDKTAVDYQNLSKIYDIEGDYKNRDLNLNKACKLDKTYCETLKVQITGLVMNQLGEPLKDVQVKVLSQSSNENTKNIITGQDGKFTLPLGVKLLEKVRLQFNLDGYTSSIHIVDVFSKYKKKYNIDNIFLTNVSAKFSEVNVAERKVISGDAYFKDNNIVVETVKSTYKIPVDGLWKDGKKYNGVVKVVTFEFDDQNLVPPSFLDLDTFSNGEGGLGLTGVNMISSGMPYLEMFAEDKHRVNLKVDNPAVLRTNIKNYDKIASKVGEKKMKLLLQKSQSDGMVIDKKFLSDNFINHPPFWILDQERGVWYNTPFALLGKGGELQTIYYTTK